MAITINESTTFFTADELGNVPEGQATGLFYEDTRFLSRYTIRLDGEEPLPLGADQLDYQTAEHFLTNPELTNAPGSTIGIIRRRTVGRGLHDQLTLHNFGDTGVHLTLEIGIDADFAGIFDVKVATRVDRDEIRSQGTFTPTVEDDGRLIRLRFTRDGFHRELRVHLSEPIATDPGRCQTEIELGPRESWALTIDFEPRTDTAADTPQADAPHGHDTPRRAPSIVARSPALQTDSYILRRAYKRSLNDFSALRLRGEAIGGGHPVLAAGIPWYMALFGRDSLIASYQALPFDPDLAAGTLRALAALQGDRVDPECAEEPGKILHEHRFGKIIGAQRGIPHYPYYGSIDSTPLFLILLAAHLRITGDPDLARELLPNARRALAWIDEYGDLDGDGYLEYRSDHNGLTNQGWKDSWDSVRFRDGHLATGPIALCEVQGYAYAARLGFARIIETLGEDDDIAAIRTAAHTLRERFQDAFWIPERSFFAGALDGEKRPVDSLTSNPGHLLWTGIVSQEQAHAIADRLLAPEFFSGWGIRTMATTEGGYNPVSYHNGSIWPHDNSLILTGLIRYGLTEHATQIFDGLIAALSHSPDHRLPELFAGYGQAEANAPVQYPTACRPQAWASGSILLALAAATGLDLDGSTETKDEFPYDPILPTGIAGIKLDGIRAGGREVNVDLERRGDGIARQIEGRERRAA